MRRHDYFVAGTDTDCGKTLISCAFLHVLSASGLRAAGMKPVATGCEAGACGDVERLQRASGLNLPRAWVNPYAFVPPVSPHIAAQGAGRMIEPEVVGRAYDHLAECTDAVIVEGTGGVLAPISTSLDMSHIAVRLGLPVLLVVGMRLGCLNHALLSAEALRARGLELAGWVANRVDPKMAYFEENLATLHDRLGAPLLGQVDYLAKPDPVQAAEKIHLPRPEGDS